MKGFFVRNDAGNILSKPILDRIRRYAQEGREPIARYGYDGCLLMAITTGQPAVVILRSTRREFAEIRSAALIEWMRAARTRKPKTVRASFGLPS